MAEKEFRVNQHIILRLEDGKTNIYVGGELFRQCKFLLLNIEKNTSTHKRINSIDEAEEVLDSKLEQSLKSVDVGLSNEEEFCAHCSNIQAWAENDYDTCLLHKSLSFPLLKKLSKYTNAKVFTRLKEEIVYRIEEGNLNVVRYLILNEYIDLLNPEEVLAIFPKNLIEKIISEINIDNLELFKFLIKKIGFNAKELLVNIFLKYLNCINDEKVEKFVKYNLFQLLDHEHRIKLLDQKLVIEYFSNYRPKKYKSFYWLVLRFLNSDELMSIFNNYRNLLNDDEEKLINLFYHGIYGIFTEEVVATLQKHEIKIIIDLIEKVDDEELLMELQTVKELIYEKKEKL